MCTKLCDRYVFVSENHSVQTFAEMACFTNWLLWYFPTRAKYSPLRISILSKDSQQEWLIFTDLTFPPLTQAQVRIFHKIVFQDSKWLVYSYKLRDFRQALWSLCCPQLGEYPGLLLTQICSHSVFFGWSARRLRNVANLIVKFFIKGSKACSVAACLTSLYIGRLR